MMSSADIPWQDCNSRLLSISSTLSFLYPISPLLFLSSNLSLLYLLSHLPCFSPRTFEDIILTQCVAILAILPSLMFFKNFWVLTL